jgi:[ribosomal protein S5]-alanine N-acetyltransferase
LPDPIILTVIAGEAELFDPAVTGQFADAMAHLAVQPQLPPFCGYIGRRGNGPVGFGGFKGALTDEGIVEISYLTFPQHEGTGVAKAIAAGMLAIARANGAKTVLAHTLCEENASTGVLRANGFVRDGEGFDEDEGTVWRWRLDF